MKAIQWTIGIVLIGAALFFATIGSCDHQSVEPVPQHRDTVVFDIEGIPTKVILLTENEPLPFLPFQALCDTISGIAYTSPTVPLDSVTSAIVYNATQGEVIVEWYGIFSGPFAALADELGGEFCEETTEMMETLVVSGYYDSPVEITETWWVLIYTAINEDPYGLLLYEL